ncbi:MAG: hypothetical protein ACTSPQ_10265 [Candidatus Helarchaeota archaeon]
MENEFIVSSEELLILFNVLYQNESTFFIIHPFILRDDLFKFKLNKEIELELLLTKEAYEKKAEKFRGFDDIFPRYEKVRNILVSSGFLRPENWNLLREKLDKIITIDPLKGDRIVYIGMDTNCYIYKLYTLMKREWRRDFQKLCFVSSKVIKNELILMEKIKSERLQELKSIVKGNDSIIDEFWNSETILARLKRLGLGEFRKLRKSSHCLIDTSQSLTKNKENDYQILEDFQNQIISRNYDLLVLTFDKQVYDMSRGDGISSILLTLPYLNMLPAKLTGCWDDLCDFIYLTSIYYGAISLRSKNNIQIFGIWKGKMPFHWDNEMVKIIIGSKRIAEVFKKQLNIIRENPGF